jgi:hypothetical protein
MALNEYIQQAQNFLRDQKMELVNPSDWIKYCNRARRELAMRTQSIRVLTPISGAIKNISLINGGINYTDPIVTITPPDAPDGTPTFPNGAQATAVATVVAGVITNISVTFGGAGYWQPKLTITDSTGSGVVAVLNVMPINQTKYGQEIYNFKDIDLSRFPGVGSIFGVKSVSVLYDNYRYSLPKYSFSTYQAHIRQYPYQYTYVPAVSAQYGQGANGSLYLYPIASQPYQLEWDCFCLPQDLIDDGSVEAIPDPWTDCIPYFMAHLAFLELQNFNAAAGYLKLYDDMVHRYSGYVRVSQPSNPYGRF